MANTIYALLVGINEYEENVLLNNGTVRFPRLTGCVNDAMKIRALLQENAGASPLFVRELYNSLATKDNICSGFLNHLGQAGEGDQAVFYYSGHGTQETADACWKEETDG